MAKSAAKKARDKRIQAGRLDPAIGRSRFSAFDMRTRTTKTRKDVLYSSKHKNRFSQGERDGSFFVANLPLTLVRLS